MSNPNTSNIASNSDNQRISLQPPILRTSKKSTTNSANSIVFNSPSPSQTSSTFNPSYTLYHLNTKVETETETETGTGTGGKWTDNVIAIAKTCPNILSVFDQFGYLLTEERISSEYYNVLKGTKCSNLSVETSLNLEPTGETLGKIYNYKLNGGVFKLIDKPTCENYGLIPLSYKERSSEELKNVLKDIPIYIPQKNLTIDFSLSHPFMFFLYTQLKEEATTNTGVEEKFTNIWMCPVKLQSVENSVNSSDESLNNEGLNNETLSNQELSHQNSYNKISTDKVSTNQKVYRMALSALILHSLSPNISDYYYEDGIFHASSNTTTLKSGEDKKAFYDSMNDILSSMSLEKVMDFFGFKPVKTISLPVESENGDEIMAEIDIQLNA